MAFIARAPSTPKRAAFLPEVEALRGLAALSVALAHSELINAYGTSKLTPHLNATATTLVDAFNGQVAVIVFFVISGFVLSISLDGRSRLSGVRNYLRFVIRRMMRIYPAHVVSLVLFVPLAWYLIFKLPLTDKDSFRTMHNLLKPWLDGSIFRTRLGAVLNPLLVWHTFNPVTWTLQVEVLASLFVPLFHFLSRRRNAALDIAVLAILITATFLSGWDKNPGLFLFYLPAFYLGSLVSTYGALWAGLISKRLGNANLALIASYILLALPRTFVADKPLIPLYIVLLESFAAFSFLSVLVWSENGVSHVLRHSFMRWNGRLSYSFYLWHFLVLIVFVRIVFMIMPTSILRDMSFLFFVGTFLATTALALLIAYASYIWVERPFIGLGSKLADFLIGKANSAEDTAPDSRAA